MKNLKMIYKNIKYKFKDEKILKKALTHRSLNKNNNERLELLGDSILNFTITELLYKKFPTASEGSLSIMKNNLIKGEKLTEIAKKYKINKYIYFGESEKKSGGSNKARLLEDTVEAIIGAIYLDSNINTVKKCIIKWYKNFIEDINEIQLNIKDAKSKLQEYLQSKIQSHPKYYIKKTEGSEHNKIFTLEVSLGILKKKYLAKGKSIKKASNAAALKALEDINNYEK